jgi:hypothetical protein
MSESRQQSYFRIGIGAIVVGAVIAVAGAVAAHYTALPKVNEFGIEDWPWIPRELLGATWGIPLIGQIISVTGGFIIIGGITLAFLYEREMTWARAAIGATVFSALMMLIFGIIPNEWLTLTQATLAWTPQKTLITIPSFLTLNNEIAFSYAALKDALLQGYVVSALVAVPLAMYWWQGREERAAKAPPPEPVSSYGRPLTKVER